MKYNKVHLESVIMQINLCKIHMAQFDYPHYNLGAVYQRIVRLYGKILGIMYR